VKFLRKNKIITVFAALAFLLHTLLPFFAIYQFPANIEAKTNTSLFGDKVLLCTAEGFKLVSWDELLKGKQEHKPHKQYKCALCYAAAHGQGLKPQSVDGLAALFHVEVKLSKFHRQKHIAIDEAEWRSFLTRSPPISFVT
jgi:hypothetical protein